MKNVVIYARGNNRKETKEQLETLKEFAKEQNYKIITTFSDSDKKGINKGIMFEFLKLQKNVDAVLIKSTDRLTRCLKEYLKYEKMGIEIIQMNSVELIPAILKV